MSTIKVGDRVCLLPESVHGETTETTGIVRAIVGSSAFVLCDGEEWPRPATLDRLTPQLSAVVTTPCEYCDWAIESGHKYCSGCGAPTGNDVADMKVGCDIDGTLLDYGATVGAAPVVNTHRLGQLRRFAGEIGLITNQAGIVLGAQGIKGFPAPEHFVTRLLALIEAAQPILPVVSLRVSMYHPKFSAQSIAEAVRATTLLLSRHLTGTGIDWNVFAEPEYRKPAPGMLADLGIELFIGDSDEDEGAASAHGCKFVKVSRFTG